MTTLNQTPRGDRLHIAIFGRRNAGKSSLINALTRQEAAIVSAVPGTTTDPVKKSMEILPIGPVVIIDTAGIDDVGELGEKRIAMTMRILDQTNLAILVLDLNGAKLGYIPRTKNEVLARLMDAGKLLYARIEAKVWLGEWLKLDICVLLRDL